MQLSITDQELSHTTLHQKSSAILPQFKADLITKESDSSRQNPNTYKRTPNLSLNQDSQE
jgi:hypothetical protein